MSFLAIVKISATNRIDTYQEYADAANADAHVLRVKSAFPDAYAVENPGGNIADLLCDKVAKTVTISPIVIPPETPTEASARKDALIAQRLTDPFIDALLKTFARPGPPANRAAAIALIKAELP